MYQGRLGEIAAKCGRCRSQTPLCHRDLRAYCPFIELTLTATSPQVNIHEPKENQPGWDDGFLGTMGLPLALFSRYSSHLKVCVRARNGGR